MPRQAWRNGFNGPFSRGDSDLDHDVDTVDITISLGNFTGAGNIGRYWSLGDFDGDGDNDTVDVTTVLGHYTGADSGAAAALRGALPEQRNPDLIYDRATGEVRIDADGTKLLSFSILSEDPFTRSADFADLDENVLPGTRRHWSITTPARSAG